MSSECSSGCQSGWTMYLAQSSDEQSSLRHKDDSSFHGQEEEEEEEEDLSMISDASSGPPQLHEVDDERGHCYRHSTPRWESNGCLHFASAPAAAMGRDGVKKRRAEAAEQRDHSSVLDDTASTKERGKKEDVVTGLALLPVLKKMPKDSSTYLKEIFLWDFSGGLF
ncbi:hypothetical protein BHE74_00050031 [Ensete ventricosum]|nr:hypothetical protein GW17_00043101 [Ensete ventricosum]RWW44235.1 hypothetical protein BHE74_00050031 [Ensete ventricosum]RZS21181.1 hypothetical protein BHM03_00053773 [Ensete ventricosum]